MTASEFIDSIVVQFYEQAINDVLIGHHFRRSAQKANHSTIEHPLVAQLGDFAHHIPRIQDFWKQQLGVASKKTQGPPYQIIKKHVPMNLKSGEINRWITLFLETLKKSNSSNHFQDLAANWTEKLHSFQKIFIQEFS